MCSDSSGNYRLGAFQRCTASESVGRQTEQKKTKLNKKHDVVITQYHILRNVLLNCLSHTALSKDFFLTFTKIIHGKNISKIKVNLPILFKWCVAEVASIRAVRFLHFWKSSPMGFYAKNRFLTVVFDSCFFDRRNLISPWMQGIKVIESILLIIWRFIGKKTIHFYSSDWDCFAREVSHSSLLSRDIYHLSHELNKTWIF